MDEDCIHTLYSPIPLITFTVLYASIEVIFVGEKKTVQMMYRNPTA